MNAELFSKNREILYSKKEAEFLSEREKEVRDQQKIDLILENIGDTDSVLEIGCGSGQILKELTKKVTRVVGVDENPDRLKHAAETCKEAELLKAKAQELSFKDEFDIVLTCQMLHEVKMFGNSEDMNKVLSGIQRALKRGGKYLLLDHLDPMKGLVNIKIPPETENLLQEFKQKFRYRTVELRRLSNEGYKISKRDLQDFVTKTWSLNTPLEEIEMNETHASFTQEESKTLIRKFGLIVNKFITLTSIEESLKYHRISLEPQILPWNRKFLLISQKPQLVARAKYYLLSI